MTIKMYHLRAKSNGIAYRRWGRSLPNALWHTDFDGPIRLGNGREAYIVVLVDARSRYCVACVAQEGESDTEQTKKVCQQAFEQFGLCDEMVSDNARIFTSNYVDVTTRFSSWLEEQGIRHLRTTPYYPEGNGKAEAFIKILKRAWLSRHTFADLADLQSALDRSVNYYNHYRGHSRLGWQAPVSRYVGQAPQVIGVADIPGLEDVVIPGLETAEVQPPPEVNAYRVKERIVDVGLDLDDFYLRLQIFPQSLNKGPPVLSVACPESRRRVEGIGLWPPEDPAFLIARNPAWGLPPPRDPEPG